MFSKAHYYYQMGTENSKMCQNLKLIFSSSSLYPNLFIHFFVFFLIMSQQKLHIKNAYRESTEYKLTMQCSLVTLAGK